MTWCVPPPSGYGRGRCFGGPDGAGSGNSVPDRNLPADTGGSPSIDTSPVTPPDSGAPVPSPLVQVGEGFADLEIYEIEPIPYIESYRMLSAKTTYEWEGGRAEYPFALPPEDKTLVLLAGNTVAVNGEEVSIEQAIGGAWLASGIKVQVEPKADKLNVILEYPYARMEASFAGIPGWLYVFNPVLPDPHVIKTVKTNSPFLVVSYKVKVQTVQHREVWYANGIPPDPFYEEGPTHDIMTAYDVAKGFFVRTYIYYPLREEERRLPTIDMFAWAQDRKRSMTSSYAAVEGAKINGGRFKYTKKRVRGKFRIVHSFDQYTLEHILTSHTDFTVEEEQEQFGSAPLKGSAISFVLPQYSYISRAVFSFGERTFVHNERYGYVKFSLKEVSECRNVVQVKAPMVEAVRVSCEAPTECLVQGRFVSKLEDGITTRIGAPERTCFSLGLRINTLIHGFFLVSEESEIVSRVKAGTRDVIGQYLSCKIQTGLKQRVSCPMRDALLSLSIENNPLYGYYGVVLTK